MTIRKKLTWMTLVCMLMLVVLAPEVSVEAAKKSSKKTVKATSVSISNVYNKKLKLEKGRTYTLKESIKPTNATNKSVTWKSSNSKIVKVTSKGKLTAVKNGTAKITATAKDGSKKATTITVTVGKRVKSVKITSKAPSILIGETYQIKTAVAPSNASNKGLVYSTSDKKIATVSSKGVVKGVGVPKGKSSGTATITVRSADGGNVKATIKVKVEQPVKAISVKAKSLVLDVKETAKASYSVSPSTAHSKKVSFSSNNKKVATVSSNGVIKTVGYGTAKITVASTDGSKVKSTVTVKVVDDVASISVPKTTQKIMENETYTIAPVISPSSASKTPLSYKSSNTKVLTVTPNGVVKGIGTGKATVTITAQDSSKKATKMTFEVSKYADVKLSYKNFVAHMGLTREAPANTQAAFVKAGESGSFMGIETDVQETKDGHFVLYHDNDLSSRTNKSGAIPNLTLAQVQAATVTKGTNISLYTDLQIPTLKDYLYTCKTYGVKPVLHIKNVRNRNNLIKLLKETGMYDKTIITAGKAELTKWRAIDKKIQLAWLCYMSKSGIDWAAANNININSDYSYVTQELVDYAHSKGLTVGAYTVNNLNTAKKLLFKGVDFITTDYKWVSK